MNQGSEEAFHFPLQVVCSHAPNTLVHHALASIADPLLHTAVQLHQEI